ncbi:MULTISPECIES: LysR family transcriptional regulator [Bradyrhizobium]|uniref:LysR family transcriptional regulator n=1 Tax=Bradyrhizobium TaxID=374 RepID=UPI00057758A8|nr:MULTISPECIES: LysR family transcriptional regulator [Bradyrhizobium]MBR0947581.1 LysR family transcriptional regulator [Bradyrhizobium liaoningense]MBR1032238.1 LysR family transcriptional regulator [Bradyrhizobium liaoningense]MDI2076446.1 LysR family transcriptional regulator [Bradyrhizobium sp. Mp27]
MDWSDLRIFLAIAREGTLGAAARKIGQTQPTMGRRLRALETALGQTLFQRTADGFVLTDEGAAVLRHAERIEEEALALQRHASGAETQLDGMLRLSSSDWFGTVMLSPVIAAFGKRHPKVTVELLTDARLYSLPRREADLVFRIKPFSEPEVISRKLLYIPYALYGRKGRKGSKPPRAGDGSGARVVTMNAEFADMPDAIWLKRTLPNAEIASRSNNRQAQAELCAGGGGFAVLPRPLGDCDRRLVALDIGATPPGRDTYVGYHRDLRRLARLRALLDLVIERLA